MDVMDVMNERSVMKFIADGSWFIVNG